MTKRQSWDNFRRCKRKSGIVEVEEGAEGADGAARKGDGAGVVEAVSQALPTVAEAIEEEEDEAEPVQPEEVIQPPKKAMRMVRPSEEREAKGRVEKEVRAATAPDSPISELLRCAVAPLYAALPYSSVARGLIGRRLCIGLPASLSWYPHHLAPFRLLRLLPHSAEQPRRVSIRFSNGSPPHLSPTHLAPPPRCPQPRRGESSRRPHIPHGIVEQAPSRPWTCPLHLFPPPPHLFPPRTHLPQKPRPRPLTPLVRSTTRPGDPSTRSSRAHRLPTSPPCARRSSMPCRTRTSCARPRCLSVRGSTTRTGVGRRTA